MKKLILFAFLAMAAVPKGNAALFISNNTDCRVVVQIYAHDITHGTCVLQSWRLVLEAWESASYNNVASINTDLGWLNGQTAATTGGTSVWGWDGAFFNGSGGGGVGYPGTCFTTTTLTVPNTCLPVANVTATWGPLGSNTILEFNP
ncbi:hypothetical protein [Taibaiella koreensis]|uniref:hypothetical protein n=1 Tax=Taibaiella koreensis TaxID=1268548 RepID=UPI0013C2A0EB|nr:hypothetical protein [Taibaiella koreensis]